jgi:hypothetical protein
MAANPGPASFEAAEALAAIEPGDTNAIAILRAVAFGQTIYYDPRDDPWNRYSPSVILWKLGLETNSPVDELIADLKTNYIASSAVNFLGEIGPPARKAIPELEKRLSNVYPLYSGQFRIALAICKIDPEEARRLGLPGLWIICPDKY